MADSITELKITELCANHKFPYILTACCRSISLSYYGINRAVIFSDGNNQLWLCIIQHVITMMGRAKQKERERKRSAASCQRLDIHFQKKSKVVKEEVITIDADISASDDDGSARS